MLQKILRYKHGYLGAHKRPITPQIESINKNKTFAPALSVPISVKNRLTRAYLELCMEYNWTVVKNTVGRNFVAVIYGSCKILQVNMAVERKAGDSPVA